MAKGKKLKMKESTVVTAEDVPPPEPKPMTEDAILLWTSIPERCIQKVPPSSPSDITNLLLLPLPLAESFPPLDDFDVPYVKDTGIKQCIEILGDYLGCTNYSFDYIQFWLLDVLTDCLWRTQDEYFFTKPEQKLVLEWILFIFKILRDPTICISRKTFFKLFKDAVMMTGDVIQEGALTLPKPDTLFALALKNKNTDDASMAQQEINSEEDQIVDNGSTNSTDQEVASNTDSSSTFIISENNSDNIVVIGVGDQQRRYVVRKKSCPCTQDSEATLGKTYTSEFTSSTSQDDDQIEEEEDDDEEEESENAILAEYDELAEVDTVKDYNEPSTYNDCKEFYKPDLSVPQRFLPLSDEPDIQKYLMDSKAEEYEEETQNYEPVCQIIGEVIQVDSDYLTVSSTTMTNDEVPPQSTTTPTQQATLPTIKSTEKPSKHSQVNKNPASTNENLATNTETGEDEQMSDEQLMKRLKKFKLWEQRLKDMADPRKGWVPVNDVEEEETKPPDNEFDDNPNSMIRDTLKELLTESNDLDISGFDFSPRTKNLAILCAIIDLVFDYFYHNFHFTLLRLALKTNSSLLTQKVNTEWTVPKTFKAELVKPKSVKPKKEKKKKDKKSKKSKKSSKSSKKSKGSKKDKKKGKKDKKSKKSDKKKKKDKPKKLTKEEKAELERQRKLQEEWEAEQRRAEENKKLLFPLADAASDNLFIGLFENWEKPKEKPEKGKKGSKGAKGKKKKKK